MGYIIKYSNDALKDAKKLEASGVDKKAKELLVIIRHLKENPYQNPPPYEELKGDLHGNSSRRITIRHRIVYQVLEEEIIIKVYRMKP